MSASHRSTQTEMESAVCVPFYYELTILIVYMRNKAPIVNS